jgi:hypothetical protein
MDGEQNNVNVAAGDGKGSSGPIIGAIIILAIIVLGGLYFWGQRTANDNDSNANPALYNNEPTTESETDNASSIRFLNHF